MNKNLIGFTIDSPANTKLVSIPLGKKASDIIDRKKHGTHHSEYIRQFLLSKKNFNNANQAFLKGMKNSLPENLKEKCKVCLGQSTDDSDRLCTKYYLQMEFTYNIVVVEFIQIVLKNKHIYKDKNVVFELTKEFFNCINFVKNKGIMFFDMDRLQQHTLRLGLLSISKLLSESEPLQRFRMINDSLDSLNHEILENKIFDRKNHKCDVIQKEFFKNKQSYYKEKAFIDSLGKSPKAGTTFRSSFHQRPNRTDIAYFCYYSSQSKEYKLANVFPSDAAWREIGSNFNKNAKNIQKVYNTIANSKQKRLANTKIKNLSYVIDSMLKNYPIAKELALKELDIAKLYS